MKKKITRQSVDSNIPHDRVVNIHDMAQSAVSQSYLELEQKALGLSKTIDQLLNKLEEKEKEILQLQNLLNSPSEIDVVQHVTDEELIADVQLNKLKDAAKVRELTLDEIRKYDLLVKNKRLAQGDPTTINGENLLKKKSKPELIKLAAKKLIGDQ